MDNNKENKNQNDEENNEQNKEAEAKRPWYKSDVFLTLICIFLPPIGYIIILSNRKKWSHDRYIGFLAVATFTMALFLIKFLPGKWGDIIFLTGAGIYFYHKIIKKYDKD